MDPQSSVAASPFGFPRWTTRHLTGSQLPDTTKVWQARSRPAGAVEDSDRSLSTDGHDVSGDNRGILRSSVASRTKDTDVPETGLPEFVAESDRSLRARDSGEPVCRPSTRTALQRCLQNKFRPEDGAARFDNAREFAEDLVTERV